MTREKQIIVRELDFIEGYGGARPHIPVGIDGVGAVINSTERSGYRPTSGVTFGIKGG